MRRLLVVAAALALAGALAMLAVTARPPTLSREAGLNASPAQATRVTPHPLARSRAGG